MTCPLCGSSLELKQINFSSAIFICMDLNCPYPVGSECIEVKRNYEDIKSSHQRHTKNQPQKDLQKEPSPIFKADTNEIKNLFPQSNELPLLDTSSLQLTEALYENQINMNQSIENIDLNHTNLNMADLDDLDNFISELLK